jgi:hypothetical protein
MKTKKFQKKLTFNKQTVADLNIDEMADIHGGYKYPPEEEPSIPPNPTVTGVPCKAC